MNILGSNFVPDSYMALKSVVGFLLGLLVCLEIGTVTINGNVISGTTDGSEKSGYI